MGFLWEGSTGSRALQVLRALPQGTEILTPEFAEMLGVKAIALHQLLANAVDLRMIKKVRKKGRPCIGWTLGPGNVSVTIERRKPPQPAPSEQDLARRRAAAERGRNRAAPPPAPSFRVEWPPGFVSQLAVPEVHRISPHISEPQACCRRATEADEDLVVIAPETSAWLDAALRQLAHPSRGDATFARRQDAQETLT
jgi:hypothetical protein